MSKKDEKLDKALELLWALIAAHDRDQTDEEYMLEVYEIVEQARKLLAEQPTP